MGATLAQPLLSACRKTPPRIDGRLDDPIWRQVTTYEHFVQSDPTEGVAGSERTVFQVAYDEEALYVGVRSFDHNPDGIVSRLTASTRRIVSGTARDNEALNFLYFDGRKFRIAPMATRTEASSITQRG